MRKKNTGIFILFFLHSFLWASLCDAHETYPFKGQIDFLQKELNVTIGQDDQNSIKLQMAFPSDKNLKCDIFLQNIKTSLFEISTQLQSFIELGDDRSATKSPLLQGRILSQYSLFNRKPINEFSGHFEIKDQVLSFLDLNFGGLSAKGSVEMVSPHKLNLDLMLQDISLYEFLSFWLLS